MREPEPAMVRMIVGLSGDVFFIGYCRVTIVPVAARNGARYGFFVPGPDEELGERFPVDLYRDLLISLLGDLYLRRQAPTQHREYQNRFHDCVSFRPTGFAAVGPWLKTWSCPG